MPLPACVGLGEEKLGWQQSFDGKEVLLRVADCLVVCCLLFCFQSSKTVLLNHCFLSLRMLYVCIPNTVIISVGCQKAVKPFCTSQCKAIEKKSSLLSLGRTILSTTISRLHTETFGKKIIIQDSLACSAINLPM